MALKLDGQQKIVISVAGLVALLTATYGAHRLLAQHLFEHIPKKEDITELAQQSRAASEAAQRAASAAQMVAESLAQHVDAEELKQARQKLEQAKTDLATTQLWEKANHPNDISTRRILELNQTIERVSAWIACKQQVNAHNCGTF